MTNSFIKLQHPIPVICSKTNKSIMGHKICYLNFDLFWDTKGDEKLFRSLLVFAAIQLENFLIKQLFIKGKRLCECVCVCVCMCVCVKKNFFDLSHVNLIN